MFLVLAQIPPPVHGAAVMNARAAKLIRSLHPSSVCINTSTANNISDVGRVTAFKLVKLILLLLKITTHLSNKNIKYCYINLHPTGKIFFRDAAFCLAAKIFRKTVILHLHGRGTSNSQPQLIQTLYKVTFKNTKVIHLSKIFFPQLAPYLKPSNFYPIPNCVDDLLHLNKPTSDGKIQLYYLSNYMRGKGALDLLKAAKQIYTPEIKCQFVLAGDWFEADFKTEIERWINDNATLFEQGYIQVLGPAHGNTKDALIKNSDVFIFPSYIDTFPLVVLEAMSAGKMIISTSTGATPEILNYGEAGVLVPERDHISLAKEISNVINNPEIIQKYSIAARSRYLNTYTEGHFKNAFSAAIKNITSQ